MSKPKISAINDELSSKLKELQMSARQNNVVEVENKLLAFMDWWKPIGHPITEQELISILYDAIVVPNWSKFTTITQETTKTYARSFAAALVTTYEKPELLLNPLTSKRYADDVQYNNFQSIRIYQVAYIADFLKDEELIKWSYEHLVKQIDNNLYDDGTSFDFHHRDSLGYHVYNVRALVKACLVLQGGQHKYSNVDLYTYVTKNTNSIKNSIHYLFPYVKGEKEHYMLLKSHFRSDKNSKNYGALWSKEDAKWLLHDVGNIDEDAKRLFQLTWKK